MLIYYLLGIIVLPGILYASYVQTGVMKAFNTYKKINSVKGITAKEACEKILNSAGVNGVSIKAIDGVLTDNYDPKNKTVNLSKDVYNSTSLSSLGVASHEVGHAIQHYEKYKPLRLRNFLITVNNICSQFFWILIIIGFALSAVAYFYYGEIFLYVGMAFYGVSLLISIVTYPVEKNASKRALDLLVQNDILDKTEVKGAEVVLKAAAQTYFAGIIVSALYFLRFVIAMLLIRRD